MMCGLRFLFREMFTCLCVVEHYSDERLLNVQVFSSLYAWLVIVYNRQIFFARFAHREEGEKHGKACSHRRRQYVLGHCHATKHPVLACCGEIGCPTSTLCSSFRGLAWVCVSEAALVGGSLSLRIAVERLRGGLSEESDSSRLLFSLGIAVAGSAGSRGEGVCVQTATWPADTKQVDLIDTSDSERN